MGDLSADQIAQRLIDLNLVSERELRTIWAQFGSQDIEADEFVKGLVRGELVTNYQLERLLKGERGGFFYGDYKVLYRVATGSFARVYRAVHKDSGKIVALKVLRRRFSDIPEQTEQFNREGQRGRVLRHKDIVPIYEVQSSAMNHFLVMEFVEGNNLRDFLKVRKKIDPIEATRLMINIASGLHYATMQGVMHRDLKMTNVLVTSRGRAQLIDFGLGGADNRESNDGANPRTIDYAGLERATGVRKDDSRSDVYFAGCIYYSMLHGKPPLQETRDRIQRLSKSRFTDVVPLHKADPQLPRVVTSIADRAMELSPDKRYQTPGEMLVDLKIALRKLESGEDDAPTEDPDATAKDEALERKRLSAAMARENPSRSLMFVESNTRVQDIFRSGLKRSGFRVLLTSDPSRALKRFEDDSSVADCIIFSTGDLGAAALDAFNEFAEKEETKQIPAVLLLGPKQKSWKEKANLDTHRVVIEMPVKLRQIRDVLNTLIPEDAVNGD